jgi:hypothetical protein
MAVIYLLDTFLPSPQKGENFLKIRDGEGSIRYKIYNNTISSTYVIDESVIIKTEADSKVLRLKFRTQTEANTAIVKLRNVIENIKKNYEVKKESSFSDLSFSIYNDTLPANIIHFDLTNVTGLKTLSIGVGNILITETELNNKFNTFNQFRFFDHFLTQTSLATGSFTTGIIKPSNNQNNKYGILEIVLASTNHDAYIWSNFNSLLIKDEIEYSTSLRLSNVPDSLDNYKIIIGFFNSNNIASVNRGVYFLYDFNLNTNWLAKTQDGATSLQNTLIPCDDLWHLYNIKFNNILSVLDFYIDDNLVASIDANLPINIGSEFGFGILIEKLASSQTTSLYLDWIKVDALLIN